MNANIAKLDKAMEGLRGLMQHFYPKDDCEALRIAKQTLKELEGGEHDG